MSATMRATWAVLADEARELRATIRQLEAEAAELSKKASLATEKSMRAAWAVHTAKDRLAKTEEALASVMERDDIPKEARARLDAGDLPSGAS